MDLKKRFTDFLNNIGFDEETADNYWLALKKAYSRKSRYYHNLTHIEEMLVCFETYKSGLQFPDEVLFALFYHDIIYKSSKKDNELKSAELAVGLFQLQWQISRAMTNFNGKFQL
jgi:predicted metal-dependent HD superfamily phosphohydrolase